MPREETLETKGVMDMQKRTYANQTVNHTLIPAHTVHVSSSLSRSALPPVVAALFRVYEEQVSTSD